MPTGGVHENEPIQLWKPPVHSLAESTATTTQALLPARLNKVFNSNPADDRAKPVTYSTKYVFPTQTLWSAFSYPS